jgi:hypothetical protein
MLRVLVRDVALYKLGDDRSDRRILGNNGLGSQAKNEIVQVMDITVKYNETKVLREKTS